MGRRHTHETQDTPVLEMVGDWVEVCVRPSGAGALCKGGFGLGDMEIESRAFDSHVLVGDGQVSVGKVKNTVVRIIMQGIVFRMKYIGIFIINS